MSKPAGNSGMNVMAPQFDRAAFDDDNSLSGSDAEKAKAKEEEADPYDLKSLEQSMQSADDDLSSLMSEKQGTGPKKSKFFHRLKRPDKPFKRAHYVPLNGRVALAEAITKGGGNPDLNYVMKLGMHLLLAHFDHESFRIGALLMEWGYSRGVDFTLKEQRTLARAHHLVFLSQGLYGEQYNLRRSRELFLDLLQKADAEKDGFVMTEDVNITIRQEFCAMCNSSGDSMILADISKKVISYIQRTADKGIAYYHLLRGAALKEIGEYDQAADCFFDALNSGQLPGRISRVEMLFIITRNLNQLEQEKAKRDNRNYQDDYEMIYLQMVQDAEVKKEVSYDEWLHNFETWNSLAQKLRMLELNNLAADLFGQGLIHDHDAYPFHSTWWTFSKLYMRCGRIPDASSSIAQALSMCPQKHQYLTAARTWWQDPNSFEEMIYMWPAWEICQSIPPQSTFYHPAQKKLKSLLKIARQRAKEELLRAAEEERLRLREEAKQKLLDAGQQVGADGRKRVVRDRNKLNPKVEWATPAAIIYPSKLTPKECNATCKDMEGIFEYYPGTDSLPLPAGEHQILVEFTPINTKKYNSVEVTVTLIIHKAKPLVKWKDPLPIYNGANLNIKGQLNAKLVNHPNELLDNDDDRGGGKSRKKRKKETLDFDENIGNAIQLVDAPDGSFEYYLDPQDPEIELPPEDEAQTRLFNDEYYFNKLANEAGVNTMDIIPWSRVEPGMRLPVGHHHILCHFIPYDLTNYVRKRVYAFIKVIPKIIPPTVWRAPSQSLNYLTPLNQTILNAKVKNIKGSYEYWHCLSAEDIAEPAYQEEIRLKAWKVAERAKEAAEIVLMTSEDLWLLRSAKKPMVAVQEKVKKEPIETDKERRKRLRREKKSKEVKDSSPVLLTRQASTGSPTPQLKGGGDDDASVGSYNSIDTAKKESNLIDEQPCCDAYIQAIALTKKRAKIGYVLPTGMCKMLCVFIPQDRLMYDMSVSFINISVIQAVPEIVWPAELPYLYTTEYLDAEKHLCAQLSDDKDNNGSGTFVYTVTTVKVLKSEADLAEEADCEEKMRLRMLAIEQEDEEEKLERLELEAKLEAALEPVPLQRGTSALTSSIESSFHQKPPTGKAVNICDEVVDGEQLESYWHPQGQTGEQINKLPKGYQAITVVYYPRDTRNYTTATVSTLITVRCRPEILWDTSYNEQLRHGLAIGPGQHCAYVTECAGSLSYTPTEGEVLDIGYYTIKAKFVPVDPGLHDITYSSKPLQIIRKIIPQITWNVKPILYMEEIDEKNICTATCELPGEFTYNIKLGDVLDAGSYSITATFIPEDSITYAVSTSVNQLVILPLQIEIAFQPDDPILDLTLTYGEPLTDKQFCAHVTYPSEDVLPSMFGEMAYSFSEGDYLPTGTNKMTATFTPLPPHDVNYKGTSTFVEIEMIKYIPRLQWDPPQAVIFGTGHLAANQLNASLVYKNIPPPGTVVPREQTVPGSRASSRAKTGKGKHTKQHEINPQNAFHLSSPYPNPNPQAGAGAGDFNYYASDSVVESTTNNNSLDNGNAFNPNFAHFQPGNGPMAQVGFSLSQVSLGIYTDYGASMTEHGSTVLGDGAASNINEGSVLSLGNLNSLTRTPSMSPMPPLYTDPNADFNESQTIYDENEGEETVGGVPGGVEDGSLTVDGTYFTAFTGSLAARSVEEEGTEIIERVGEGDASASQSHLLSQSQSQSQIDHSSSSAPARLKVATNSKLEAYSTKPITHVMPNMPFDPALESYVVGRQIRKNKTNTVLGKEVEDPIPITGTIRYMPEAGYVFPHAGVFVLRALFLPDDALNIAPTEISVEITVLKARPTVRWTEPQPMFSETPIGPLQLNATVHCPGLRDDIDGQMEYYPGRGEVLPVGLHVLRCRYVPFQRAQHNYDCTNSWSEVPLLVKPKPFNKEYLDNLAPRESTTSGGKRKKKAPKDTWVAGMAWPDPKEVIAESQKGSRKKRPATTAGNSGRKNDLESARLRTADNVPNQEAGEYKLSDEWNISPRTKGDLQALSTNINAAAEARELLSQHSHRARTSASNGNSPMNPNVDSNKAYMRPQSSPDAARLPLITSPQGANQRSIPTGDDLIDSAYAVVENQADEEYRGHFIDVEEFQFEGSNFSASFHNSNVFNDENEDREFERVGTAASSNRPNIASSSVQFDTQMGSQMSDGASGVVVDAFDRPIYALDSDKNSAEWLASYSGEKVEYPEDTVYSQIGKKMNFKGGIPVDADQRSKSRAATAPKESSRTGVGLNAYLVEGVDTNLYHEGKLTDSNKIFRNLPPETLSHKPRNLKSSPVRAQTAQVNPSMHFGTSNTGKHTTQTIDDLMEKSGKKLKEKTKPFEWNMFVDKRKFESSPSAVGNQKTTNTSPVRDALDEHTARHKLVRLERQINSLRRDAYGIAKMVTYVEKIRAKTAGTGTRTGFNKSSRGEAAVYDERCDSEDAYDYGEPRGFINPYTGEYILDGDESTMYGEADGDNVGIQGDPQGLNRIPGIGTGAAKRVVTSYEMEHPYVDVTVHARNKVDPTPEALLYTTGQWAGGFKETYAISTSASDRMTDQVGRGKGKKGAKLLPQNALKGVRPSTTDTIDKHKPATAPLLSSKQIKQFTGKDPQQSEVNNFVLSSMSIAERALRDSAPPQIPPTMHGVENPLKKPKKGSAAVGNAVNVVRTRGR